MDTFSVRQGTALPLTVTISDVSGPITTYAGSERLGATVWPGSDRSAAFSLVPTWADPAEGTISLLIPSAGTSLLSEGRWYGTVSLADPVDGPIEVYNWAMDVEPAPGLRAAPPAYCDFDDLLKFGRSWVKRLQTTSDDAGFAWACGYGRRWLDDMVVLRAPGLVYATLGDPGYGASAAWGGGPGVPNQWLRTVLDAGGLIRRDWVIEVTAKRALHLICDDQIGMGEAGKEYRAASIRFRAESYNRALASVAEVYSSPIAQAPAPLWTEPGSVVPNFFVNLGAGSLRR